MMLEWANRVTNLFDWINFAGLNECYISLDWDQRFACVITICLAITYYFYKAQQPADQYAEHVPVNFLQNTISDRAALHCTATARILIPAECSAIS